MNFKYKIAKKVNLIYSYKIFINIIYDYKCITRVKLKTQLCLEQHDRMFCWETIDHSILLIHL